MPLPLHFNGGKRKSLVNLTPLIDVVFILLLFFMLASSTQVWQLLTVSSGVLGHAAQSTDASLLISLKTGGSIYINGRHINEASLYAEIARHVKTYPDAQVLLAPQPGISLQTVINLLEKISDTGAAHVRLMREQTE